MNVNNYINWNLVRYSVVLSFLIIFNYFLWSINSWQIIKFINFYLLFFVFFYFFISKKFNDYWYLKIIIILLLLISLGTPTVFVDARTIYLISAKILSYESDLYSLLENDNFLTFVTTRPKLPATLSATFVQLLGFWNEIYPKSTNVIVLFPAIIFLISFLKDKVLTLLWLFLMLFFSGKLFINGSMDGIISVYFVSSILVSYKIIITKPESKKILLYFLMFLFFSILSLCKNEGGIMVLVIILSSISINFIYEKKINYKFLLTSIISLCPVLFWRYKILTNNIKLEWVQYGDPINRVLGRITNPEDLFNILSFLARNEKLILSLIIFIFFAYKYFSNNRKIIFFVLLNFLLYFSSVIGAFFIGRFDLLWALETASTRVFIPLCLLFVYFSIFIMNDEHTLKKIEK